jgi:glycosyltransferase involved in cell wall biosynthesis
LFETIKRILGQTLRELEFLVIDDDSTIRTAEILAGYASRDGAMCLLRHGNKGRAASLNIGINLVAAVILPRWMRGSGAPTIAGRPVKWAFTHLAAALKG